MNDFVKFGFFLLLILSGLSVFASATQQLKKYVVVTTAYDGAVYKIPVGQFPAPGTVLEFTDQKTGERFEGQYLARATPVIAFVTKPADLLEGWKDRVDTVSQS